MNPYTEKEICPVVLCIANQISLSITTELGNGDLFRDDYRIELIKKGMELKLKHDTSKSSLRTYLNKTLKRKGIDIIRQERAKKRSFIVKLSDEEDIILDKLEAESDDVEGREEIKYQVQQVLLCLDADEKEFALLLQDMNAEQAKKKLGWSHGKMRGKLAKLREKFKNLQF